MRKKNNPCQRGVAAVEFGLLLVPLCLILFGIIDYGWAFMQTNQLTNAAREGARAEAVGDSGQAAAERHLDAVGMSGATIGVSTSGDAVTVDVQYPFTPLVGFVPTPPTLSAQVVMRLEAP